MSKKLNIDKPYVEKLINGDHSAYEYLFNKYHKKMYHFSLNYLSKEDAEGLVQEIFLKIWIKREDLDPNLSFNSYLFTSAKNAIFNLNRKKINEGKYIQDLVHYLEKNNIDTEQTVVFNELNKIVEDAVKNLPQKRKEIYLLKRQEDLSYKEIADKMAISVKTVENHINKALHSLRDAIKHSWTTAVLLIVSFFS